MASTAPVSSKVIYELQLLERHYRYRITRRYQVVSSLRYTAEDPLNGRQWHKRESIYNHGICPWTGPGNPSTIDLPLAANCDLKISFEVVMALLDENLDTVKLFIDDEPVKLKCSLTPTGFTKASFPRLAWKRPRGWSTSTSR